MRYLLLFLFFLILLLRVTQFRLGIVLGNKWLIGNRKRCTYQPERPMIVWESNCQFEDADLFDQSSVGRDLYPEGPGLSVWRPDSHRQLAADIGGRLRWELVG